jgi:arylsulfatase A-like enzyme
MDRHGFDDWCMWTGYETRNPPSGKRYHDPYVNTPEGSGTVAGGFGPDVYVDHLIGFMRRNHSRPMLLYFPMALTHTPLVATPDEPGAESKMDRHLAMVRYTDKLVGRLVDALEELHLREKTIIIFTTDNGSGGGITGSIAGRAIRGGKAKKTENGVCAPFIVNCPGRVPAGRVTGALTDFTDLFPTFAELAGAAVPADLEIDGVSIAPLLLGETDGSEREWIMALGHGPARLDDEGVRGKDDFAPRVIRDERYKVWIEGPRTITRLHDLELDPFEEKNLVASTAPEHRAALVKFGKVAAAMPERDGRPRYRPRQALPWDKQK